MHSQWVTGIPAMSHKIYMEYDAFAFLLLPNIVRIFGFRYCKTEVNGRLFFKGRCYSYRAPYHQ